MAVDLKSHPGLNPDYFRLMSVRRGIMAENRARTQMGLPLMKVPPQPNKYVPHVGAKQRSKTAAWPDGPMDKSAERRK